MGGDFNLPDIDWSNSEIKGGRYSKTINQNILDTCDDNGLTQVVDEPTRGQNTLDIFFTSNPNLIKKTSVVSGLSDHEAVRIECSQSLSRKKQPRRPIRLWKRANHASIRTAAQKFCNEFLASHTETDKADEIWESIKSNLLTILDDNVPTKLTSGRLHKPWINTQTKRLLRQKQRMYTKAKTTNTDRDWTRYRNIKKLTQKVCRKTHASYVQDIISDDKDNKKLWTYIRSNNKEKIGIADLDSGSTLVQDPTTKANMFNTFFSNVFSTPDSPRTKHVDPNPTNPMPQIRIGQAGVLKLLLDIKENKATGPDGIPGNLLKICAHELAPVYTVLFQASLDQGCLPSDWKKANIVPVFKKGNRARVENYRPISLTSVSSKLLEHIIHSMIMDHLERHSYLNENQHGFRQRRSCETQLITTVRDFTHSLNEQGQTDSILLDFSKAFDKVDHDRLLTKLSTLGIGDSLHQWIHSFLSNREQAVLVDGSSSSPAPVLSGVPQGTVLGPLLFLVYINDISDGLSLGTIIRLFADDALLYRQIKSPEDHAILQKDLNHLQTWADTNKMEFHPAKCQVLRFTNKRKPSQAEYKIQNTTLARVDSAKYLGVILDSKLNWSNQISAACGKASRTLSFLQRNLYFCPTGVKEKCVNTLVRPVLEYGCCVWDPHQANHIEQLEKVQRRCARFVTGNHTLTHGNTKKNLDSLGWPSLETRRARAKLYLLFKAKSNAIELPLDDLVWKVEPPKTRRSSPLNFPIPDSTINSHKHSFFPSTVRLWNNLPELAKTSQSLPDFRFFVERNTLSRHIF